MLLSSLRSQNPALFVLRRAITRGQFPSAYLFEGPPGVGKRSAALGLALAVLCEAAPGEGCGVCHVCQRILAGNHPDARVFGPREEGKRNIQVESLRNDVLRVAQFAPFEGKRAFFVFPDADVSFPEQHPESSNALLKTLEEPRPGLTFVLISERPERLLVTIRSRCQRLRFGRLPPLVLEQILEREGVARDLWEGAIALADGRADRALALAEGGLGNELVEQAMRIDEQLAQGDVGRLVELSEALSKRDDLPLVLETVAALYRDVAVVAAGGRRELCVLHGAREAVERRASALGVEGAAARVSALAEVPELFAKNANPQVVLDHLLTSLRG
jgi:DNA polymerase III subunit delta'